MLRRLDEKIAPLMEINDFFEKIRDEIKGAISSAMKAHTLLLDPDAKKYSRPVQGLLYDRPVTQKAFAHRI